MALTFQLMCTVLVLCVSLPTSVMGLECRYTFHGTAETDSTNETITDQIESHNFMGGNETTSFTCNSNEECVWKDIQATWTNGGDSFTWAYLGQTCQPPVSVSFNTSCASEADLLDAFGSEFFAPDSKLLTDPQDLEVSGEYCFCDTDLCNELPADEETTTAGAEILVSLVHSALMWILPVMLRFT